jgi:CheY-like chemotaxis protein
MCDADRLQQIVWNLLSNAIKFTPEGGRVELQVERHEPQLIIRVQDSGIGIEPEFLPHVFERFRQADSATTRRHGGLGLGLAIVRHLVEMHGGRIEAHSAGIGQGATFSVHLPLRPEHSADTGQGASQGTEAHAAAAPVTRETLPGDEHGGSGEPSPRMESRTGTQPEETGAARPAGAQLFTDVGCVETPDVGAIPAPISPDALANVRVLLVDDERDARDMVAAVLAQSGAVVTQAASVAEALLRLGRETPQILISDISMPDEDGYMLIRRVRAAGLGGHEMPAIALTARAREQDRQTALDCGFSEHLSKPVHPDTLVSVTARLAGAATSTHSGTTGSHSVAE